MTFLIDGLATQIRRAMDRAVKNDYEVRRKTVTITRKLFLFLLANDSRG